MGMDILICLVLFAVCAGIGIILFRFSNRKNPQSTQKTVGEMLSGFIAGLVTGFSFYIVEKSAGDKLVFLLGCYVLFCLIFFSLGIVAFIRSFTAQSNFLVI